jgi:hypothetical protein
MAIYYVSGISGAVGATADHAMGSLWNPSSTKRLKVLEVCSFYQVGTAITAPYRVYIARISARGTATTTVTPTSANDANGVLAPGSGALLDVTYTTTWPTIIAEPYLLVPMIYQSGHGQGFCYPLPLGIIVLPGTGLAVVQLNADSSSGHTTSFVWEE